MTEVELYKELGTLTKNKEKWKEHIPYVASLLTYESVQNVVPKIATFLDSQTPLLRERAINAIGRIGRGSYHVIEPYWVDMFRLASDEEARVRLAFVWASENIAMNTPYVYENYMSIFEVLLHDADDKVRMEAPEMFRVLGKRRPEFVRPYTFRKASYQLI